MGDANGAANPESGAQRADDAGIAVPAVMAQAAHFVAPEEAPMAETVAHAAEPVAVAAPSPLPVPVFIAPVTSVAPVARAEPFVLPLDQLQGVAETAGLQWVNSDVEKMRAAREAMASEPAAVRVPREVKAAVAVDDGPLVLVETRKDLSQFKLPFESADAASRPAN